MRVVLGTKHIEFFFGLAPKSESSTSDDISLVSFSCVIQKIRLISIGNRFLTLFDVFTDQNGER